MGNHEYCVDCGESDFHYGRECNPVLKAKMKKEEEDRESRKQRGIVRLTQIKEILTGMGIKAELRSEGHHGYLTISWYDVIE